MIRIREISKASYSTEKQSLKDKLGLCAELMHCRTTSTSNCGTRQRQSATALTKLKRISRVLLGKTEPTQRSSEMKTQGAQ